MRRILIYLFLACKSLFFLSSCNDASKELHIRSVDDALKYVDENQKKAFSVAEEMSKKAHEQSNSDLKFKYLVEAGNLWLSIDLNKSLILFREALNHASFTSDSINNRTIAGLNLASLYVSQGSMLMEANDIFESLNKTNLSKTDKIKYYILGVQLNRALEENSFDPLIKKEYTRIASLYRDSVLLLDPNSTIIAVNKLLEKGNPDEALALMRKNRPHGNLLSRDKAPYYHYMAELFKLKNDKDSQIYYLALSAAIDLNNGVKEYKALPQLAELIKASDPDRAYRYINQSVADAESSHSEIRLKELSGTYYDIQGAYNASQEREKFIAVYISVGFFIIVIVILIALVFVRNKNRRLSEYAEIISRSKNKLEEINSKLNVLNARLIEESRVKEHFVKSFMELSSSYLAQMEKYRAGIAKYAAKSDWSALTERINNSRYVNKEIQDFFNNFDNAFLSIYPDFIIELNLLLKDDYAYDEKLTKLSTELRVYALIKLGITESNQIAQFLKCSESTVYNYRTKMRNKAKNRNTFEQDLID